ncbi:MAG: T9SS type A sorting domain-containing protein [Flavobacteriales bacterium]|nr:T9SS type A sorting domain-containing protein [Flavobacteriales bacterium]
MRLIFFLAVYFLLSPLCNSQSFSPPEYLSSTPFELRTAALIDLDGDDDLDALAAGVGFNASGIETWINNGSSFSLVEGNIPFSNLGTTVLGVADINMDGSEDFAAVIQENLVWFANNGSGQFSNPIIIADNLGDVRSITFGQLDAVAGDEIVITRIDSEDVLLFANNGSGDFGNAITVTTESVDPIDAQIGDLNGDGMNDIVVACLNSCDVTWHENLGGLNFGLQTSLGTAQIGTYKLALSDFDQNGQLDIASVGFGSDDLSIWFNSGSGVFGTRTVISTNVDGATNLALGDFNDDGNDDLCVGAENSAFPTLFLGDGLGSFTEIVLEKIGTVNNPEQYLTGDVNNDGKIDLLTASQDDNKLSLFLQKATVASNTNPFFNQFIVNKPASGVNRLASSDIDGDGAVDLITSDRLSGKINWYQNIGNGSLESQKTLLELSEGISGVAAGDLNEDGFADLVVASRTDSSVTVYINGGASLFFSSSILDTDLDGPYSPVLSDLDADGDLDILQAVGWDESVYIYENQGNGTFGSRQVLCDNCLFSTGLAAADLNGDELPEILVYVGQNQEVEMYENLSGLSFGAPQLIVDNVNGCRDIEVFDFDADGDLDVFVGALFVDRIKYAENIGGLNFEPEAEVPYNVVGVYDLEVLDVDLDGDEDLAYADFLANQTRIILMEDGEFVERRSVDNVFENPINLLAEDFNGDGSKDLCSGFRNYVAYYANEAKDCSSFRPENLEVEFLSNSVLLTWDPIPGTVACRVTVQENVPGAQPQSQNIFEPSPSSFNIPLNFLTAGSDYNWRVQCACELSPLDITAPSLVDFFSLPGIIEVFPNPTQETIQIKSASHEEFYGKSFTITDLQGRTLSEGIYNKAIDVNLLPSGYYLLKIGSESTRFLKN